MFWRTIALVLLVGALSGCVSTENVQVNAITAKGTSTAFRTFAVVSGDYQPVEGDLGFVEYARQY